MAGFPNVPNVPGVPPLVRNPLALVSATLQLMTTDLVPSSASGPVQWGIFQDGEPVIVADSVVSFDFRQEYNLLDYPVEGGTFQSYNKVQNPFDARIRLSSGGSEANRQHLIDEVGAIIGDFELYDVVTPEKTYHNVNLTHQDYRRTSINGAGMVVIDIWLKQIRVSAPATFTSTKTPAGAGAIDNGAVAPTAPTPEQLGVPAVVN